VADHVAVFNQSEDLPVDTDYQSIIVQVVKSSVSLTDPLQS